MYFYIQEIQTKREIKGSPKRIEVYTEKIDGVLVNCYRFSDECFSRSIRKAYCISLRESYRENGKVKQNQFVLETLNYYEIAESYKNDLVDFKDSIYYRLLIKLDSITAKLREDPEQRDLLNEELGDLLKEKLDSVFTSIVDEFRLSEEGKVFFKHQRILQEYKECKRQFLAEYDSCGQEYAICYDLYGNLINPEYLERIKRRSYDTVGCNNYTDEQKGILKVFYRDLVKRYHPDANLGIDSSKYIQMLNLLKEEWKV